MILALLPGLNGDAWWAAHMGAHTSSGNAM